MRVCFADLSGTTVFAEERGGATQPISLVRMRVCFADLLGNTVSAEKRLRATWTLSLDSNDSLNAELLGISTNARISADTGLCISMVSMNVTRTITDRRSALAMQVTKSCGRNLNGLQEYS